MKQWVQDLILGLILLAFSVISFVYAFLMQDTRAEYFLARADTYILLWVSILGILSLMLIIRSLKKRPQEQAPKILTKRVCVTCGIILAYLVLLNYLGFFISSLGFLFALCAFFTVEAKGGTLSKKELTKQLIIWAVISIITALAVQYLFGTLLGVQLPGPFWE